MMKNENNSPQWIETDPDSNQFGRYIGDGVYEFKEDRLCDPETQSYETYSSIIDINSYSDEDKLRAAHSFAYNSIQELEEIYGDHAEWVLADSLFELEY